MRVYINVNNDLATISLPCPHELSAAVRPDHFRLFYTTSRSVGGKYAIGRLTLPTPNHGIEECMCARWSVDVDMSTQPVHPVQLCPHSTFRSNSGPQSRMARTVYSVCESYQRAPKTMVSLLTFCLALRTEVHREWHGSR